jgi:hypothetical protein
MSLKARERPETGIVERVAGLRRSAGAESGVACLTFLFKTKPSSYWKHYEVNYYD